MAIPSNPPAFKVWVRLVRAHRQVRDAVEAALKSAGLPPLEWYDVLLELEKHGSPLRARDLEQKLLLAQYNLSRLLDRLEAAGLVRRQPDPDDGRSRLLSITEKGLETRRRSWPVYRQVIEERIGSRFDSEETLALADLLESLVETPPAE